MKKGFNNELYMQKQYDAIMERINKFDNKLYVEFGGKLFDDFHAARILPGFDPNVKTKLLLKFKDIAEVIFCINANDLERNKIRADLGISYGSDVTRLVDNLRAVGLVVSSIVITQYSGQPQADIFKHKLENRGEKVYIHTKTKGYPTDVDTIVSDEGYGKNPYIETTKPLVIVTAPGPGSGKLATCLCQLYHESKRGVKAGYAKYETFPIWNLPLKHPVNLAYEAATADLKDVNMIDHFHLEAYNKLTVNYNRDIEVFPVVRTILEKIMGETYYKSPTDMGVNMAGYAITDDEVVCEASKQEIVRRYYHACVDSKLGIAKEDAISKIELLMSELGLSASSRPVVAAALKKAESSKNTAMAIELSSGEIIVGRSNGTMTAAASCVLNAVKSLCDISDKIDLISPTVLMPIIHLKQEYLKEKVVMLNLQEILTALSICAVTNPVAEHALTKLLDLRDTEAHYSCIIGDSDGATLRKLGINLSCEPVFESCNLYY